MRSLNLADEFEREQFEKAFYLGFQGSSASPLMRRLWDWDESSERLRSGVPYEDQMIWVWGEGSSIDLGIAVNFRLALLQSGALGFSLPDGFLKERKVCEFLAFFSNGDHSLVGLHLAWSEIFSALRGLGYTDAVATCVPKLLPLYRRVGATILDRCSVEGEFRYFLRFEFARSARWVARLEGVPLVTPASTLIPEDALSLAVEDLGVLLARLLSVMDLARGHLDRNFDVAARLEGSLRVAEVAHSRLAFAATDLRFVHSVEVRFRQLYQVKALWEELARFAGLAVASPSLEMAILVESLEAILLTVMEAWDGESGAAGVLHRLMSADRQRALDRMLSKARGQPNDRLDEAVASFNGALEVIRVLSAEFF